MSRQSKRMRRKKRRVYAEQDGQCHYCDCDMLLTSGKWLSYLPPTFATWEHLDDKYSPHRGTAPKGSGRRVVLACHQCNHARGRRRQAEARRESHGTKSTH